MDSGRIQWRQDPWTPNVWNYRDLGDVKKKTAVRSQKQWSMGQEYNPTEEDHDSFQNWRSKDLQQLLQEVQQQGKGKGGKALRKGLSGKGKKNKGKGSGQKALQDGEGQLALQDGKVHEEEETEESWHKALQRAKKSSRSDVSQRLGFGDGNQSCGRQQATHEAGQGGGREHVERVPEVPRSPQGRAGQERQRALLQGPKGASRRSG